MSKLKEAIRSHEQLRIFAAGIVKPEGPATDKILTLIRNNGKTSDRIIPIGEVDTMSDDPNETDFVTLGSIRKRFNRLRPESHLVWAFRKDASIDVIRRSIARTIWEQTQCFIYDRDYMRDIMVFEKTNISNGVHEFVVLFSDLRLVDSGGTFIYNPARQCYVPKNSDMFYNNHKYMTLKGNFGFDPLCVELVKNAFTENQEQ